MKKIAILTCLKANTVCTGASCFQAFHQRTRGFQRYAGQEVQIAAFMKCNGCTSDPKTDAGIKEKVARLKSEQIETVHIGACTLKENGERCENIAKIIEMIKKQNISIVEKTHDL